MKILNLYSGIGGNRKYWEGHDITAVEKNKKIAKIYRSLYPEDKMIIGDAHSYLIKNFQSFDFIWGSPPCPTHSKIRKSFVHCKRSPLNFVYPDMSLYQEVLFLQHHFKGLWLVENVVPYYKFLIKPTVIIQRHAFWSNFYIPIMRVKSVDIRESNVSQLEKNIGIKLPRELCVGIRKDRILRNCVYPKIGKHILKQVTKQKNYGFIGEYCG